MKLFLLLLHEDLEQIKAFSPRERADLANAHMNWANTLAEKGYLISADGLHEKSIQITGKDGVIKDEPYLESKKIIGGYYLLQADNLDTIVEVARECPTHHYGGTTEIRPIMNMEDYAP